MEFEPRGELDHKEVVAMGSVSISATGVTPPVRQSTQLVVRPLAVAEMAPASELLADIWQRPSGSPVDTALLVALSHGGNYVAGAFEDGHLVAVGVGFFTEPLGQTLHSHIVGVAADSVGRGIGAALKQHQQQWSRDRGITAITWTFDPLVARNAYFNVHRLGARPCGYLVDFYGDLRDGLNGGQASDRLFVKWSTDEVEPVVSEHAEIDEAHTVLTVDERGRPGVVRLPAENATLCTVEVPADIESLRVTDSVAASQWRVCMRDVLPALLDAGWEVFDVERSGRYVLRRS